ncbi:MAG TPA: peptidoglycan DD-metalloendopeptidase family protein [Prolixibacteraceae bacterium]|nr:peptidoglycan DD-metalloendopeptidase family protein [Prolixibacteraceae bacterium]
MKNKIFKLILLLFIAILIIGMVTFLIKDYIQSKKITPPPPPEVKLAWGFPVDSIKVDTFSVQKNQCLSDLLTIRGVDLSTIDQIAKNSKLVFDVRHLKSGNTCYLIRDKKTLTPTHFIYEESPINFYTFELKNNLKVTRGIQDVDTIRSSMSGTIESSLWNSFIDRGADPNLAIALSDIFAWTVDFFGVQKGDRYRFIYDEYRVNGKYAGIGKIYCATFESEGEKTNAYLFEKNGQVGYYDEAGNSLRKAFLKAPLSFSRISSHFSASRFHPILKIRRPHYGVDYAAPTGTPVYSIGDGVVSQKAFQAAGGGNYLVIKHNSIYTSQYMHLSKFANGITPGVRVKQGQLIGFVGMTGLASGPHLDFRIFQNGSPVDPLKVKTPPVEPISTPNKIFFNAVRDSMDKQLEQVAYPTTVTPLHRR